MSAIPSPLGPEGFNEFRKNASERGRIAKKALREQIERGADEYIRLLGKPEVEKQRDVLKASIDAWNDIAGASVRLSVPTLDAMLIGISSLPPRVDMAIASNNKFADLQLQLHAIKRLLISEATEKLKRQHPEL